MKTFLLILAITVSAQAQKAHERYDKFTDTTEATSGQLTVFKCGLLAPPCTMSLESFVLKKNGNVIGSGLRVSVLNETGWYPNDSVLYVLTDGERRLQYGVGASKTEAVFGRVRTTLTYDVDVEGLRSLLGANTTEMKMDSKSFKLKDRLKDLRKIVPYLESVEKTAASMPASYGITLEGYNLLTTGMSYTEVVRVLGEQGIEMARSEVAGYSTISYQWKAKQGLGNMILMFQNNKLISKAQAMLK